MYVCSTAIEALGDSDKFPQDWLMKHRWGKGKKDGGKLPNGAKITFLKVGGRTSAVVPSVQKKTGAVAGDVSEETNGVEQREETEVQPKHGSKRKAKAAKVEEKESEESAGETKANTKRAKKKAAEEDVQTVPGGMRKAVNSAARVKNQSQTTRPVDGESSRRRSSRLSRS
jgi:formamidopyrimidine-DNA glycosylase